MVGDRSLLPPDLLEAVETAEAATIGYTRFHLNIALAYGGRNEIVSAARRISRTRPKGRVQPAEITPALVEESLADGAALCLRST